MFSDLSAWTEWKERCALGLCGPEAQHALRTYGGKRFREFVARYAFLAPGRDPAGATPSPADCWHLFETHLTVGRGSEGKRYKDWLFARVALSRDPPLKTIRCGALLLMRDVAREYLRKEFSSTPTLSLQAPPPGAGEGSLNLEDLLPGHVDPSAEAARHEIERLAHDYAGRFFKDMSRRERIAVLARHLGLSLADPAVEQAAGCGKSALNKSYHVLLARLGTCVKADYPGEDREMLALFALAVIEQAEKSTIAWARMENALSGFFKEVKTRHHEEAS